MAGRPSAWKNIIEPHLDEIAQWKADGHTEKQIAELLGIGYTTLNENKVKYPLLAQRLKLSKATNIDELEKSLFQIARGGFTTKKTTRKYIEINGVIQDGIVEVTETITEHKPEMAAIAFSLKNLASDKWQDKIAHTLDNEEISKATAAFLNGGKK